MTKEMKLSLAILGVLALGLGGVLTWRVFWPGEQIVATNNSDAAARRQPKPVDVADGPSGSVPRSAPPAGRWADASNETAASDDASNDETADSTQRGEAATLLPPFGRPIDNAAETDESDAVEDAAAADRSSPAEAMPPGATLTSAASDGGESADLGDDDTGADPNAAEEPADDAAEKPRASSRWQRGDSPSDLAAPPVNRFAAADDDEPPPAELNRPDDARAIDAPTDDGSDDEPAATSDGPAAVEAPTFQPAQPDSSGSRAKASRPLRSVLVVPGSRASARTAGVVPATHTEPLDEQAYTVGEGESLFDVARARLGHAARWVEIYELNREVLGNEVDLLTPGTRLVLPDAPARF